MGLLDGKVALITGAGGGLGEAYAKLFAREGAAVVVNDVGTNVFGQSGGQSSPADAVVVEIRKRGGRAVANYADVGNWNDAKTLVEQALDEFGALDVLVNNAGILRKGPILDLEERDLLDLMRVHVHGTAIPLQHAGRYWRQEHQAGRTRRAARIR